jgi:hypothetical protein
MLCESYYNYFLYNYEIKIILFHLKNNLYKNIIFNLINLNYNNDKEIISIFNKNIKKFKKNL